MADTTSSLGSKWGYRAVVIGAIGLGGYTVYRYAQHRGARDDIVPPAEFICPITHELMNRPVFTSDGHTYERLAIVKWLHEHSTSPKTGAQLPDRDIRPNHSLRAQIADFRAKNGMEELPPWNPDPKETVKSIMPADNQMQGQVQGPIHGTIPVHVGGPGPGGGVPFAMPGMRMGPGGPIGGPIGGPVQVRMGGPGGPVMGHHVPQQFPVSIDAFSAIQSTPQQTVNAMIHLLSFSPFFAASVESGLDLKAGTHRQDSRAVAELLANNPQVLYRVVHQCLQGCEMQRVFTRALFYDEDAKKFSVPGNWSAAILAVRNNDIGWVEQHISQPAFVPTSQEATSLIVEAVWCREAVRMVKLLHAKGVSLTVTDSMGCSILSGACHKGDLELVNVLLSLDADANHRSRTGSTALHQACFMGHENIVKKLLESNANPTSTRDDGASPLLLASSNGHHGIVDMLVESGGRSILGMADIHGITPLSAAARGGSVATITKLVELMSAEGLENCFNFTSQDGLQATHQAAICAHIDVLEYLLTNFRDKGLDIDASSLSGDTILHIATARGNLEMVKMLLNKGAKIDSTNRDAFTPLHSAAWRRHNDVLRILVEKGADISATTSNRSTVLHLAAWYGNCEMVSFLIEAGAQVSSRTRDGDTALHQAAFNNHNRCLILLLERHGNTNVPSAIDYAEDEKYVDAQKVDGNTPLHLAVLANHKDCVDSLINFGCDINLENRNGQKAIDLARMHNRSDITLRIHQAITQMN